MTPRERAQRSCQAMWGNDQSSKWFGMELGEVDEGKATMTLQVMPHHCNGHAICHGGVIFALADSAFAFACNSRNQNTVAQHNMISFLAPGKEGDLLTAVAEETYIKGRSGIYDIHVTNQDGTRIAEMRGMSRAIPGTLFEEEEKQ
ncbi:hydroxyphenylacetyl-CoA thioesterase PaaI [Maritimibacter sp. DP07]|uniref:Hydroxyphenylacetyl-CoA thioesterase PaaI n=1 Tax=Maritimibacter harenae TaxID=2606218 RepID=A0A845M362_9RHOB|nr:hydroxyphenylacetyl-CoA thioesterase PaaI [Maritimibacter harenae]MZR12798.1 hydroxyphenylacetyl-CoA thioesterase PaaI [Maritimibacter harenae]